MADELQSDTRRCFVSFKLLQFPPQPSTRAVRMTAVPARWVAPEGCMVDAGFLHSWLEDEDANSGLSPRKLNWGAISGLVISLSISGAFWIGVGSLIALLLANGFAMTRAENRIRLTPNAADDLGWKRLRATAGVSMILWFTIALAGVALVNTS